MKITELIKEIDVWTEWQQSYARFVPRFISNAIDHTKWQEWDEDVFWEFFQRSSGQCVSSIQQKYFDYEEQQSIKDHWDEIAPSLKMIAESQDTPLWDTYEKIKETIREHTKDDKRTATNRLIASLQPKLLCTIVQEKHLDRLYNLLVEFGVENTPSCEGDWFHKSHTIYRFICDSIENWNPYETSTLSWQIKEYLSEKENKINEDKRTKKIAMEKLISLLQKNKNIILTGAPGTGKTYLAKQIAQQLIFDEVKGNLTDDEQKQFDEQCGFVQFHPSYDYTDFVEGLRPIQDDNGNVGFERKDGVFKEFCKKALSSGIVQTNIFDDCWDRLIDDIRNNLAIGNLTKIGNWEYGLSSKDSLKHASTTTPSQYSFTITKENVFSAWKGLRARPSGAFQKVMEDVVTFMKSKYNLGDFAFSSEENKNKNFVFIIDEINRGEISKIFGELFFSIDPGYRGKKGKVKTQYQNLIEVGDEFYDGFFVPENVYIIGTMNDIDRSVESMDFAFRRRFAFKEIKADDNIEMLEELGELKDEAIERMKRLNAEISKIEELSSAYHIGAAYFLKLKNYAGDADGGFENLWNNHLEGLLCEYLRGSLNIEESIAKLKAAYNNESPENNG